jgi:hypothetical protein
MDAEQRRWLETLAVACEQILLRRDDDELDEVPYPSVWDDTAALLSRLRAELEAAE